MSNEKSAPRSLQQQPARDSDPQQQRSGATDFQSAGQAQGDSKVEGEGSYTATREYQKNLREYLDKADVQKDADAAKPKSESEAREIEEAEREGRSHSKGER
jgi:hypothetical protein